MKKKIIAILFVFLFLGMVFFTASVSAFTLRVKVTNKQGTPIKGARVFVSAGRNELGWTDAEGIFETSLGVVEPLHDGAAHI